MKKYYVLMYELVDDYLTRRTEFREEHLRRARELQAQGEIILAGAFSDPPDQALFVFHSNDTATAEKFAAHDPYVKHGLVKRWTVRPWTVVIGNA